MLSSLSIRDVVLIDALDLTFHSGLTALTGETGAGKSILLDCLGLALGSRSDSRYVRLGADQASVTATFEIPTSHPVAKALSEQGLNSGESDVILRRVLGADGRSKAFVNDQPISIGLLKTIGANLVEIHGQFDQTGLLDVATHRSWMPLGGTARRRRLFSLLGGTGLKRGTSCRNSKKRLITPDETKTTCAMFIEN
ncbi:MAG: AAA family ATPase [Rhodospirillaceae bacterium]|nr:AAA family ATPase [Rhodospirillaceae bacterium]